jgi:hypothetical protein
MHLAVIVDASSSCSKRQNQRIKSLLCNRVDGLFDMVAKQAPGEFSCPFIQFVNHSSASAAMIYPRNGNDRFSLLYEYSWSGNESHDY